MRDMGIPDVDYQEGRMLIRASSDQLLVQPTSTPNSNAARVRRSTVEAELQAEVNIFLRHWGDTGWRGEIEKVSPVNDPELARLVLGVAGIEDDAFYMQVKLRYAGVLRSQAVQQFNAVWLTEESDHGRAFTALARKLNPNVADISLTTHGTMARDRRAIAALPLMKLTSLYRRGILGGYLVRGAIVEHVAIAVYGALMRQLKNAGAMSGAEIVRRILLQEGRHLRFFTRGAQVVLGNSPSTASRVRHITGSSGFSGERLIRSAAGGWSLAT